MFQRNPGTYPHWTFPLESKKDDEGIRRLILPTRPDGFWGHRIANAGSYVGSTFWKGMQFGAEGSMIGLPFIAMEAGMAQRGEVVPTLVARSAGLVTYPVISGLMSAGVALLFPELKWAAGIGSIIGMYPDALVQDGLLRGLRLATDASRRLRHLEVGGSYQDTNTAQAYRLGAINEMSGAMAAGRRYLGQEAAFFHR